MKHSTHVITLLFSALLLSSCASTQDKLGQQQSKQTLERIEREKSHADWEQTKANSMSQTQSRSLQNMTPRDPTVGSPPKDN